jgi:hypothetical protein
MTILPASFDTAIHLRVEVHTLQHPPQYQALSYCWGVAHPIRNLNLVSASKPHRLSAFQ